MKLCEVKDCGQKAEKTVEFKDTGEYLFVCSGCKNHLVSMAQTVEAMSRDEKLEHLRAISTPEEFEQFLVELGELPLTYKKGNQTNVN